MKLRRKHAVLTLALLAQAAALLLLAGPMAPVKEGTSVEFWRFACGVDLDDQESYLPGRIYPPRNGIYQPRDGWYIYYMQGQHGQVLYRVTRSEAIAGYPEVLQRIAAAESHRDVSPAALRAIRVLDDDESAVRESPEKLLAGIREARLSDLRRENEERYEYSLAEERAFAERWNRVHRYWLNLLLESVYFACLTLFAFWPWLKQKGLRSWCIHMGLLPVLLLAPCYMGYAAWTFTSAGPSGGVLYPWVIVWFSALPLWTPLDSWILERIPPLLKPISQPLGPMLSISGRGAPGPVGAIGVGLILSGLTWRVRARRGRESILLGSRRSEKNL